MGDLRKRAPCTTRAITPAAVSGKQTKSAALQVGQDFTTGRVAVAARSACMRCRWGEVAAGGAS